MTASFTKALVIDQPWIGHILSGDKVWEMRSQTTHLRGWIGLIEKGSGHVVGVAELLDSLPPLDRAAMLASHDKHRIPADMVSQGQVDKWHTPWVLGQARRLASPVAYVHAPGAVVWVNLDEAVSRAIAAQVADLSFSAKPAELAVPSVQLKPAVPRAAAAPLATPHATPPAAVRASSVSGAFIGKVVLTDGNLRNNHFYLTSLMKLLPADAVGGKNIREAAPRSITVDWGGYSPVSTDIDGSKKIFRSRGWVAKFFAQNGARPGDKVRVHEVGPYQYQVRIQRA